jgi:formylglycine-generating enzyme required for sulfatase activity
MTPKARITLGAGLGALFLIGSVWLGLRFREGPVLCPDATSRDGARCRASAVPNRRVAIQGNVVSLSGADWEGKAGKAGQTKVVSFEIDSTEVTGARYERCVAANACSPLRTKNDPELPVREIGPQQAEAFCQFSGGRLPTGPEWLLAAAGKEGRRFPWGSTGLVCRRAVFGLGDGPCASGVSGPDAAGSRPDGKTPDGVLDLAGNVAEWAREPGHRFLARGGSYLSKGAAELKSWAATERGSPAPDIGFRCAYPSTP